MTDPALSPVIELREASFGYGERAVVQGVDLGIGVGESVAIVGPNGCGKSTLVKGVLGLNQHMGGEVLLFGTPLADFRQRPLIGYVPQRHTLSGSFPSTVREVVAIGRLPMRGWFSRAGASDAAAIDRALCLVDMSGLASADVSTLSGGQQRRVLIARALASGPRVLIMDEPTAGVDASNQASLSRVMQRLSADGVTQVVVTHEIDALRPALTRVVSMVGGGVDFDGSLKAWDADMARRSLARVAVHHDFDDMEPDLTRTGLRSLLPALEGHHA